MPTGKESVVEPSVRFLGDGAVLFINDDFSWSVGLNTNALVKVQFGDTKAIDDSTYGFSAMSVEKLSTGGYKLFVRSDADNKTIVEVFLDAQGQVSAESIKALSVAEMRSTEDRLGVDLDGNGGFGDGPVLIEGGAINLYMSADGAYQVGTSTSSLVNVTVSGQPLAKILPPGWELVEIIPVSGGGFEIFAQADSGDVYEAIFDASGAYASGEPLTTEKLAAKESSFGADLNGNKDLPAAAGWTSVLKDAAIKSAVDAALAASSGKMSYTQLVGLMNGIIDSHKSAGDTPITGNEVADLQALASRGKTIFAGESGKVEVTDYLSYVFSKMVDGSIANNFYTGGQATRTELGNLAAGSSVANLEKLVSKWLLGGDLPSPTAGGDAATGKASTTVAVYEKSAGTLFVDGITPGDVKQGALGDCFMVAALVTIADVRSSAIQAMIVDNGTVNGSRTWGVRMYDAEGKANWVTVNDMLPVGAAGSAQLVFGGNPTADLNGEIWVPLLEKAYAQANSLGILPRGEKSGLNAYWAVEGGFGDPMANVLGGGKVTAYLYANYNWENNPYVNPVVIDRNSPDSLKILQDALTVAVNSGKAIWIGSGQKTTDPSGNILLTGGHAFSAQDADPNSSTNSNVLVYNPWGIKSLPTPPENVGHLSPFPYTLAELIGFAEVDYWIAG